MKNTMKRAVATGMAAMMTVSGFAMTGLPVAAATAKGGTQTTLLDDYQYGDSTSGIMARFWFPDAGAGYDADGDGTGDYVYQVAEMITDMVDAGFGGCEITMLLDNSDYAMLSSAQYEALGFTDDQDAIDKIGWGSQAWAEVIACATDTANQLNAAKGTDFHVDVTITAHWPMIINSVAPNDDEQQQQLVYTMQEVTAEDLKGNIDLDLPEMKTEDVGNSSNMQSTYIFKDTLVGSELVQYGGDIEYQEYNAWMGQWSTVRTKSLDYNSLEDVTDLVTSQDAWKAGVPYAADKYMKLVDGQWVFYATASEIDPSWSDVDDYIVLKKGTNELYAPGHEYDITAATSWGQTTYTVVDKTTGETLAQSDFDIITPGNIVQYSEDGTTCDVVSIPSDLIVIKNRHFLGDRDEMTETQETYDIDGTKLDIADETKLADGDGVLEEGEYILVNVYRRGTGQIASGGGNIPMTNKTYEVDYFSSKGAQKVVDYWEENMMTHQYKSTDGSTYSLKEIMSKNGATIFEDSIELAHTDGNLWSVGMEDQIEKITGLKDARKYMVVYAGLEMANAPEDAVTRIKEDLNETMSTLYATEHLGTVRNWTKTFGYAFRTQCHGIDAVDCGQAALSTDIAESDNATDGYGTRAYAGAKNVNPDNNIMSNESLTFGTGFGEFPSWKYAENTINRYYSEGINRVIYHGTPFKKSFTATSTANNDWPGWDFMSFMAWNSRQTWWDDVDVFTNYTDRIQAILQNGQSKIPVAVLVDATISNITNINSGVGISKPALQQLIGNGYNYNIITRGVLESDTADLNVVTSALTGEKVLSDMAEFQVIVLDHIDAMSLEATEKLVSYAKAGVAIVDVGSTFSRIYGTEKDGDDAALAALYEELKACDSYYYIADDTTATEDDDITVAEEEMLTYISENVAPLVSYSNATSTASVDKGSKWLEATRIYDAADGSNYYMLYNESGISVGAEQDAKFGPAAWNENGDITTTITVTGDGVPYILDPATGEITKVTDYTVDGNKATMSISIQEGDLFFIVMSDSEAFAAAAVEKEKAVDTLENIELGGDTEWNLNLTNFTADKSDENMDAKGQMIDPTKSTRTAISLKSTLCSWSDLALTEEELATLGITGANKISGIGVYSIDVDVNVPKYATGFAGGILHYTTDVLYNNVTEVTVTNANGTTILTGINANHDYLDLGTVLVDGKNTITIKVCSDLTNASSAAGGFGGFAAAANSNGLTDASLEVYSAKEKTAADAAEESADAAKEALAAAEKALEEAQAAKDAAVEAKEAAETAAEKAEADLEAAKAAKDDAAISAAEAKAAAADAAVAKADAAVAQAKAELAEAKAAKAEAEAKVAQLAAETAQANAEAAQAAAETAKAEAETAQANAEKAKAEAEAAQAKAEAAQAKAETAQAKAEKAEAEADAAAARAETAQAKAEAAQAKAEAVQQKVEKVLFAMNKTSVKLTAKKKAVKVTWKSVKGAAGYVVKYSAKKSMSGAKKVTVSGTSKTLKGLKKGQKVYVKVAAYKKIGGTKVYSKYSSVKSVKVK